MKRIEKDLQAGVTIMCANIEGGCASEIEAGDEYVIFGEYMYCCQECADESTEGVNNNERSP